jgi:DNA-binding CsgD family transcriptional regulator
VGTRRTLDEFARLAGRGLPAHELIDEVIERVRWAVRADRACVVSVDPETLLVTETVSHGLPHDDGGLLWRNEYREEDVLKHEQLAFGRDRAGTLAQATGGRPGDSARYRDLLAPLGIGHELRAAAVDRRSCWAILHAFRDSGAPAFDADDVALMQAIGTHVARGIRIAMLASPAQPPSGDPPGVIVLSDRGRLVQATAPAVTWLAALGATGERLPPSVHAVAHWARAVPDATGGPAAFGRARTDDGRWVELHASPIRTAEGGEDVAVVLQPARGPDLGGLLMRAFGLTPGERDVVERVRAGASTKQIAADLHISPYTVQDRLKVVFAKAGVHSRRELAALLGAADAV